MPDLLHWSAALLALLGLLLWFWSGGLQVPQTTAGPHPVARLKRQIRRVAIFAAVISALLQAGMPAPRTHLSNIELWASAAPADVSPIG